MKGKTFGIFATVLLSASMLLPAFAQAESLDQLDQKASTIARQSDKISAELQIALNDVNETYQEVNDIRSKIEANQETMKKTKAEIVETEKNIEKRKEIIAQRMKEVQVNNAADRTITTLLEAENLNEFLNRAYAMSVIQQAEKEKVTSLNEAKEKLAELKATQETTQTKLLANEKSLADESAQLDKKMANLKSELAANKTSLEQISQAKEVETARIAAEKAQKEKAEKEAQEAAAKAEAEKAAAEKAQQEQQAAAAAQAKAQESAAASASSSEPQQATAPSQPAAPAPAPIPAPSTPTTSGRTIQMQSTAYSCAESVNTYYTALGIDLRQNPQVVAVDPSVVPLGSMVEVSGYGIAIAGDTGGAIKGNIVDVHFPTVEQCIQWGRRSVTVTIIS
ncbi:3D domain-containing protein [Enterococcus sp. AZ109]|uniref:3D domain-containing protein n=1 Tax=Enterococcus sp. AZ109 TaxID=2774634 RepID=UPI003F29D5EC